MEVRMLTTNGTPGCPFTGTGMVVVLEQGSSVRLFYPVTLDEWSMPARNVHNQQEVLDREGFAESTKDTDLLWPENHSQYVFDPEKVVGIIRKEVQRHFLYAIKTDNLPTVITVLVQLSGKPPEEVQADLEQLKASTVPIEKPKPQPKVQYKFAGSPGNEEKDMAKKEKKAKTTGGHRNVLYLATSKLDPEKLRGQRKLVAQALGAYSTPKSLTDIVNKCNSNGGYKINAAGGITDSVHFHLRALAADGLVKTEAVESNKVEAIA